MIVFQLKCRAGNIITPWVIKMKRMVAGTTIATNNEPLTIPLSSLQNAIWLDQLRNPDIPHYNIGALARLNGPFDLAIFKKAIAVVTGNQEALRLTFGSDLSSPYQTLIPDANPDLAFIDLENEKNPEAEAWRIMHELLDTPFCLDGGLMWSTMLIRVGRHRYYWLTRFHHLICDGTGGSIFISDVFSAYNQIIESGSACSKRNGAFLEFVEKDRLYLESPRFERDRKYWVDEFRNIPSPILPARYPRGSDGLGRSGMFHWPLGREKLDRISQFSEGHGQSATTFFVSLIAAYFARVSGLEELTLCVPVHNRSGANQKSSIGAYMSMVPVRITLPAGMTFSNLMAAVSAKMRQCYRYQHFPVDEIYRSIGLAQGGHDRLYDVRVSFDAFKVRVPLGGVETQILRVHHSHEQFPLSVSINDYHVIGEVVVDLAFNREHLEMDDVRRMVDHLDTMIEAFLEGKDQPLSRLSIMTSDERRLVLEGFNETKRDYPEHALLHELFEAQVERSPDAVAVICQDKRLTYAELNAKANRLAHRLRSMGVTLDTRVAICIERSLEMVIGMLGILKAGGAYIPLDPDYPEDRIAYILDDASATIMLTQSHLQNRLPLAAADQVLLLDHDEVYQNQPDSNIPSGETGQGSRNLAYVIYTSGSTGSPKGVMNEHRGVINRVWWFPDEVRVSSSDRILQKTPFSFDGSVWEFYWALLFGAQLIMAKPGGHQDPYYLASIIDSEGITHADFVPSMLQIFVDIVRPGQCRSLRCILSGGEEMTPDLQDRCLKALPECNLYHTYGPTEAAVEATCWKCERTQGMPKVPIGRPISNVRIYILDSQREPVPIGVTGEIYIGGDGVARAYLGRPDLTRDRFLEDPFSEKTDGRMYRTGDLGRWRPDGAIEYQGRNDFQVKIRGQRVELGEIEARLVEVSGVREAVVVVREDRRGGKRLVAYWTRKGTQSSIEANTHDESLPDDQPSVEILRAYLKEHLPNYMVPAAFVQLDAMPLTPSGKTDRKALPEPDVDALQTRDYEAPADEMEMLLAAIWQDLLEVEKVGRHDNFFDLGGHSLLIVAMAERLRERNMSVEIRQVFSSETLADMACSLSVCESDGAGGVPDNLIPEDADTITPDMLPLVELTQEEIDGIVDTVPGGAANVQDIYPLAPLQEGVLFHHRMSGGKDAYLITATLLFESERSFESFTHALQMLIDRHDVLRTAVVWSGVPQAVQVVYRKARLPVKTLETASCAEGKDAENDQYEVDLDLTRAPLMRVDKFGDGSGARCRAQLTIHHIINDHFSLELILNEMKSIMNGVFSPAQEPVQYRNFVAQQIITSERREKEAEIFFRKMLSDVHEPTAPYGLLDVYGDGRSTVEKSVRLEARRGKRIRSAMRNMGSSPAAFFHAAFGLVMAKCSGRDDVVFGSVMSGRLGGIEGVDRMLGMFINTLPVRLRLHRSTVEDVIRNTDSTLRELVGHEQTLLSQAQRCSSVRSGMPLFNAIINYVHSEHSVSTGVLPGVDVLKIRERTNYPLLLVVDDHGEDFDILVGVDPSIDIDEFSDQVLCAIDQLLDALEGKPNGRFLDLSILSPDARKRVLRTFNETEASYPSSSLIHELFELQVSRTPDALAVQFGDRSLSYAELNRKANQLAHLLVCSGVGPDTLVAICVERGLDLIVSMLGVLKAGGAYVPVDPDYPKERISYIIGDSGVRTIITQKHLKDILCPDESTSVLIVDDPEIYNGREDRNIPASETGQSAHHLAYVIYTSGSTGKPKGVLLEHSGLCNLAVVHGNAFHVNESSRVLQFASASFDACVSEVFMALTRGASLHLGEKQSLMPGEALLAFMNKNRITHVTLPPAALGAMEGHERSLDALETLIVAGDTCSPSLAKRWRIGRNFINAYGPTETTVCATLYELKEGTFSHAFNVPIGSPIANVRIYILDKDDNPVPVGVEGEICIAGAGLARGYLNRNELTQERFVADPFSVGAGERMYRTGDLGRWRHDGTIEHLGRNDFQVKILGLRIEPGEIEARIGELDEVGEVLVLARPDKTGEKRLVAYWIPRETEKDVHASSDESIDTSTRDFRSRLRSTLPDYMIPSAFVRLDSMPLTPNGKVDREALPEPDEDLLRGGIYEPPVGTTEEVLATMWRELLGLEKVGRNDSFFELGGNSILLARLASRIRSTFGVEIPMNELFNAVALTDVARMILLKQIEKFNAEDVEAIRSRMGV
jgi:amino acid adenylation domain